MTIQRSKKKKLVRVYFPADIQAEINGESARLDRSPSWLLARAWEIAKDNIRKTIDPED